MNKISVIILTKNEEINIEDCIKSVAWADEIIVVDDYSTDKTIEILNHIQNDNNKIKIFQRSLNNDFSGQRNFGLEKAGGDWVLFVDADERLTPELTKEILKHIRQAQCRQVQNDNNNTAYKIKRKNFYFGNHEWPKIEKLERLFKKDKIKGWSGKLHESPTVDGAITDLDGFLLHYTHQNLFSMLDNTIKWSEIEAGLRYKAGHPKMTWWRFPRVMISEFCKYYFGDNGYRAGTAGLIESLYQSFSIFITYARLWELQKNKGEQL